MTFLITNVSALEINSKYGVLYNLNDGKVICEKNKDEVTSVASLTKIMTTLVAIDKIENYQEKIVIKSEMLAGLREANAYQIGLRVGQEVTYNDLIYGMFLASGADATRAIVYSVAGSEEKFVELMNKKAQALGLKQTHFINTVGLDAEGHHSTVNEVATILKIAFQNEKFKEIFLTDKYTFSDKLMTVSSSMKKAMTAYNIDSKYILGGKTGYTGNAGRCLASIAYDKKNKITYLLVTTGADSVKGPVADARDVYNYYFENYGYQDLVKKGDLLVEVPTKYSKTKKISFLSDNNIKKYLENNYNKGDIKLKYEGIKEITPFMKKGDKLGSVEVFYKDEVVEKIEIRLERKVKFSLIQFFREEKILSIIGVFLLAILILLVSRKTFLKK